MGRLCEIYFSKKRKTYFSFPITNYKFPIPNSQMVLTYSQQSAIGSEIPNFVDLPEVFGDKYSLSDFESAKILVVIFMCNHCPYVQAVLDRINALAEDFISEKVQFIGINSNDAENYPDDSFENMKKVAEEKKIKFLYLYDESQKVAKDFGAVCTPDIFVYKKNAENKWILKYQGAIDDNWKDFSAVSKHYLRDAIFLLLQDKEIDFEQKASMGCSIKWKN